jgi:hypothetical protein
MRLPDLGGFLPVRDLDDVFQSEGARRLRGRRSAGSHDRKIMVWKTQALCVTVRPK